MVGGGMRPGQDCKLTGLYALRHNVWIADAPLWLAQRREAGAEVMRHGSKEYANLFVAARSARAWRYYGNGIS